MKGEPLDGLPEAKGIIGDGETSDLSHLGSPPLLQIMASKVIEAQYPLHLQYHGSRCSRRGSRHQEETHMKINLPIFKDEDAKDAVTYQKLEMGLDSVHVCWL